MKILERLAAAAELEAFVMLPQEERCLDGVQFVLDSSLPSTALMASTGQPLLAAWLAAARGMQLAAQQLDLSRLRQHSRGIKMLWDLVGILGNCFRSLKPPEFGGNMSGDDADGMRVALSELVTRAGERRHACRLC